MRSHVRVLCLAPLIGAILAFAAISAPAAQAAFGVEKLAAVNCKFGHEKCAGSETAGLFPTSPPYSFPKEPNEAEAKAEGFVQAGGRIPYGVTDFELKTTGSFPDLKPEGAPVKSCQG